MTPVDPILPLWTAIPFAGIVLSIAFLPLVSPHLWAKHYPKVAFLWALPMAVYVLYVHPHWLVETGLEYLTFIFLLSSLYIISGGIYIKGSFVGRPAVNVVFLLIGGVLASFIGTTGASMVLIRPLIRANKDRPAPFIPIIFFIFVVCNMGGLLTPLGDPPLFLGFLKGVPFFWTTGLWDVWLFANALTILFYFLVDTFILRRKVFQFAPPAPPRERFRVIGMINVWLLLGVVVSVVFYGALASGLGVWREVFQLASMALLTGVSLWVSPAEARQWNQFTYTPIKEVAILFASIFVCMIPAMEILRQQGAHLGLTQPVAFFWITGGLSSFLDNAPTYLTFMSLAQALPASGAMLELGGGPAAVPELILRAISIGAVFMGALTYIGNGPNFMVKAVVVENGIRMPSFFGYMIYSIFFLMPIFVVLSLIFV